MEESIFSRRHAFKLAGLAGAAVALRNVPASAQDAQKIIALPPRPLPQGAGFYRTQVGEIELTIVSDGQFPLTPFPTIGSNATQAEVEGLLKENFIDPANLMGQVNTLTIRRGNGPVTVVDTGSGKLFGPAAGFAKENLLASGVRAEEVENVIFTHLHPDHAGGAINETGKLTFANAKHWVHAKDVAFWKKPDFSKSGVPEAMHGMMAGTAQKLIATAGQSLNTYDDAEKQLIPGVTAVLTGGHTPGHVALRIADGNASVLYVSDLIVQPTLVLAHPEWFVGFDTDMQGTTKVRQEMFAKIAAEKTQIAGSHLPFPSLGHIRKANTGFEFVPSPWRWA